MSLKHALRQHSRCLNNVHPEPQQMLRIKIRAACRRFCRDFRSHNANPVHDDEDHMERIWHPATNNSSKTIKLSLRFSYKLRITRDCLWFRTSNNRSKQTLYCCVRLVLHSECVSLAIQLRDPRYMQTQVKKFDNYRSSCQIPSSGLDFSLRRPHAHRSRQARRHAGWSKTTARATNTSSATARLLDRFWQAWLPLLVVDQPEASAFV